MTHSISSLVVGVALAVSPLVAQMRGPRALDASQAIPYFIATGAAEDGFQRGDRQLAEWALQAWQRVAAPRLALTASRESDALIRLYWAGPNGGEYGEMRPITVGGKAGAAVFIRPDMAALGDRISGRAEHDPLLRDSIVYLTCVHELGHAFGLEHTKDFRDIMYFFGFGGDIDEYFGRYRRQIRSRADIATVSGLSEADVARIKSLYPIL